MRNRDLSIERCQRETRPSALVASLWATGLLAMACFAHAQASEPPPPSVGDLPRFAEEDTLSIPVEFWMDKIEVKSTRLKIGDIVAACIEREKENQAAIESWVHTQVYRGIEYVGGDPGREKKKIVREKIQRVFWEKPDRSKTTLLRDDRYSIENGKRETAEEEDDDASISLSFDDLSDLPFYLEDVSRYGFEIRSREIVGATVIYEVELEPKSDFEIAPRGKIWVDTSNFQILREEFDFEDRVPLPLFIKRLGPFVRERELVDGVWLWKQWFFRVEIHDGRIRTMARLAFQDADDVPRVVEGSISFRDHRVNRGWQDADESGESPVTTEGSEG